MLIRTYGELIAHLNRTGFMTLSETPLGLPALARLTREEAWHTGLDSDPWQWKNRAATEGGAAYGHLLLGRNSFVSLSMFPNLFAAVRGGKSFYEIFSSGLLPAECRRVYALFAEHPFIASHELMSLGGFSPKERSKAERALILLQSGLFISCCGTARKVNRKGEPYGWPSSAYTLTEHWAPPGLLERSACISPEEGASAVTGALHTLNPALDLSRIRGNLFPFSGI